MADGAIILLLDRGGCPGERARPPVGGRPARCASPWRRVALCGHRERRRRRSRVVPPPMPSHPDSSPPPAASPRATLVLCSSKKPAIKFRSVERRTSSSFREIATSVVRRHPPVHEQSIYHRESDYSGSCRPARIAYGFSAATEVREYGDEKSRLINGPILHSPDGPCRLRE